MAGNCYSIRKNRIQSGWYPGFVMEEDGSLTAIREETVHYLYLKGIDSAVPDSQWGRIHFNGIFSENMICYIHVIALNEDSFYRNGKPIRIEDFLCSSEESNEIKKRFLRQVGAKRFVNQQDMLLYQLKGRYLYLVFEVIGEGDCRISRIRAEQQGDNFMGTFPEVYRERNSFFHRFMSIFSSIYNDFQGDIDQLPELLDVDICPGELLPIYAGWLGIDVGNNFLEENVLRLLVKNAYRLNRIKGTKAVLEQITEIVLNERALVLEKNVMESYISPEEQADFNRLYGSSIYDVTILVENPITEAQKSQLMFLLDQFKPVRSRIHIVHLKKTGMLDSYSYLDMNAGIQDKDAGTLDSRQVMDGIITIQ